MNKKNTVKKTAALMMGLALTVGATGCNFIVTDTAKDYAQTIVTVDISNGLASSTNYKEYAGDISAIIDKVPSTITKRDLVSYFMSYGYQYVESYGYTYEATFNMLLDALVSREIIVQYSIAYYLKEDNGLTKDGCLEYIKDAEYPEIEVLKYFLTDGGTDMEEYDRAVYNLNKSLNTSLDSLEAEYIEEEEGAHDHGSRTKPTGAGETETEGEYYTKDYAVYTGRNTLDSCGEYEKVEGSTTATRQKAYNKLLANLQAYNLIKKGEDTKDITKIDYYYVELTSSLGQALINKYYEDLEATALKELDAKGGEYVTAKYDELYNEQKTTYKDDTDAFATAMDSVSDESFLLFGLKDYGFVYNILLPFSASQGLAYETEQSRGLSTKELYDVRRDILSNIKGEDLRTEWIDEHDHANSAFKDTDDKWYFFEENVRNKGDYKELDHFSGVYPFNGTIDEETMEAKANKVTVDEVLDIFLNYVESELGLSYTEDTPVNELGQGYSEDKESYFKAKKDKDGNVEYDEDGKIKYTKDVDYSNFVYRAGKVNVTASAADYFNKDSDVYKMLTMANELMFAYSTDTGCLNTYMGYSVSPYKTNYMKEFEYAAQKAVEGGVGSYAVCPTDYGWHIIITTFVYEDGDVYGGYNHAEKDVEGTFSYLFYEALKGSVVNSYTSEIESSVLKEFNTESCVTKYTSRYQDLLDMDA